MRILGVIGILGACTVLVAGIQMTGIRSVAGDSVMEAFYNSMGWAFIGLGIVCIAAFSFVLSRDFQSAETRRHRKVIAYYDKNIEANPNDAAAYYRRGLAYQGLGEVGKAVSDLNRCIELSTDPELTRLAQQALHEAKKAP